MQLIQTTNTRQLRKGRKGEREREEKERERENQELEKKENQYFAIDTNEQHETMEFDPITQNETLFQVPLEKK